MKNIERELNKILKQYGKLYTKELINNLRKYNKKASGKLIKSISTRLLKQGDMINIIISSEEYLRYIDQGRKPGSYPPIDAIKKWCRLKGISETAAFPIARKIFKFGIKPTNVIDETTTKIMNNLPSREIRDMFLDNILETLRSKK